MSPIIQNSVKKIIGLAADLEVKGYCLGNDIDDEPENDDAVDGQSHSLEGGNEEPDSCR
jgi:hypothetical protein